MLGDRWLKGRIERKRVVPARYSWEDTFLLLTWSANIRTRARALSRQEDFFRMQGWDHSSHSSIMKSTPLPHGSHPPLPSLWGKTNADCYFLLPGNKLGCQVAAFWLGAAAVILIFSFFGFLASRLPRRSPLATSISYSNWLSSSGKRTCPRGVPILASINPLAKAVWLSSARPIFRE